MTPKDLLATADVLAGSFLGTSPLQEDDIDSLVNKRLVIVFFFFPGMGWWWWWCSGTCFSPKRALGKKARVSPQEFAVRRQRAVDLLVLVFFFLE